MKNIVFLTLFVLPFLILAQNVGVNNSNPDNSAQLDITSASKGLLIPRMTEAARLCDCKSCAQLNGLSDGWTIRLLL